MERILVTGGNGFLGSHLTTALKQRGYAVRILARRHGDEPAPEGVEVVWGDVRDEAVVDRAVQGVDRIIHTISNFRRGGSDKEEAYSINVDGTMRVLEACQKYGVKQLIHCSTIGVHGDVREIPATEDTPFNPGDLYQETKLEAEQKVWQFAGQTGLNVTVIRPISLIGPGDTRMLKLFTMIKRGRFLKIGPCRAFFQPAYIDDVVDGFLMCLANDKAGGEVFIIGSDEYIPLEELFQIIADELGVRAPRIWLPLRPVLIMAYLCEAVCVPLGLEPPLHRRRVSFFQNNRAFSVDKAKRLLGYAPRVSLKDSIRRTIAWYEEHGWL